MSTTETHYGTGTWLDGDNQGTNYDGELTMKIGQQTERANVVLNFDISDLNASTVVKSVLKFTGSGAGGGMGGGSVREIYAYRLDQDFTNDEATWQRAAAGTLWTGGNDVGAANNSAITQYSINARRKLQASVNVGFRVTDATELDITELVKDAINRNSGTLMLWVGIPLSDSAATSGYVQVHSPSALTATNRPKVETTVAERIVWDGSAGDGNAQTASNWVGDSAPDYYDYAVFNDGAVDVTSGAIFGNSCFIGEGYTGTIEATNGDPIGFLTIATTGHPEQNKVVINKKTGRFDLKVTFADTEVDVFVENTPREIGSEIVAGQADKTTVMVAKTGEALTLSGAVAFAEMVFSNDKNGSRNIIIDADESPLKSANSKVTVESGISTYTLSNNTRLTSTKTSTGSMGLSQSWIVGGSVFHHKGSGGFNDQSIANGTLTFKDNESAKIQTDPITLWKKGVFDPRTNVGAWQGAGGEALEIRGGNFLVDVGRTLAFDA
tara:strand:- start:802 stop:2289 length:1488 start_codon:yes stop_codon:yes gene_type:complete